MAISFPQAAGIVAVTAICTIITRALPFLIFSGKKEPPAAVSYIGKYLPPAVMAVLLVYCVKDAQWFGFPGLLPNLIAIAAVVLIHQWKRNNLLSIASGTVLYMVLIQMVFK